MHISLSYRYLKLLQIFKKEIEYENENQCYLCKNGGDDYWLCEKCIYQTYVECLKCSNNYLIRSDTKGCINNCSKDNSYQSFDRKKCVTNCFLNDDKKLLSKDQTHCVAECEIGEFYNNIDHTCYLCSEFVTDCELCTNSTHCIKCLTKALKSDGSQCVENCSPEYKNLEGTKCVADCYNDDSNNLKSLLGNLCVIECNEGEFNYYNECINNTLIQPKLTIEEIGGQIPGQQTIYATCDQNGKLYYVISSISDLSVNSEDIIINKLITENTTQTELGTKESNPTRSIYGSKISIANQKQSILITGKLESRMKYYINMFCVNYNDIVSELQIQSWIQASNKGKPVIIVMKIIEKQQNKGD